MLQYSIREKKISVCSKNLTEWVKTYGNGTEVVDMYYALERMGMDGKGTPEYQAWVKNHRGHAALK